MGTEVIVTLSSTWFYTYVVLSYNLVRLGWRCEHPTYVLPPTG